MKYKKSMKVIFILFISACSLISWSDKNHAYLLSHQEALVGVVQLSGFFEREISSDLTLHNITYLLSSYGITVNVLKLWRNDPFTEKDMARMLGQIYTLHRGEIKKQGSEIDLPGGYDHWIEFCDVHGLDYQVIYRSLVEFFLLEKGGGERRDEYYIQ